ncbi:MAG: hypothetical protein K6T66_01800 [Peptococcaceae bacterium]|nr:hypothetical protein [Peptococcaceae bacterium]
MAGKKQAAQAAPQVDTLEIAVGRVKKDLVWVLISVAVSVASGLIAGNFFKY